MKKLVLSLIITVSTMLSTVWAYDFSAVSPSGHTLYYEIISGTTNVGVVRPGSGNTYNNYISGNVVIPDTVSYNDTTYNVTELKVVGYYGTFDNCTGLTSVIIPNSVTTIGDYAFYVCTGLTSVIIPNSVTTIGEYAFNNCTGLTSVTIPASVTTICEGVFKSCTGLTSVTIPNSVTTIGDWAFNECTGLATLNFNAINCSDFVYGYHPFNRCPISTITIGDSVQRIPKYFAYNLDSLRTLTIGNSVTSIGIYAFYHCTGLTSVTIPNSVTTIGNYAFNDCTQLTSVTIGNSVTTIGTSAFNGCTQLTSVTIGNSVTSIGGSAFDGCIGLTSVTIPTSVTTIGASAFSGCTGLTSVTIPTSVTTIGIDVFNGCTGLTTLNFNAINCNDFNYSSPFEGSPISTITIGDSVKYIPRFFADNLNSLRTLTIGNSVTSIGYGAFFDCSSLTSVTIPNSVTTIGTCAFFYCTGLTSVVIGPVDTIGGQAFCGCTSIGRIDVKSVTPPTISISSSSFGDVSSTVPVYIPCGSLSNYSSSDWGTIFSNLQESQVFSFGVAVNDSAMGMASILSDTCANTAIQAYPYDGYNFVGWSDGNTTNPRIVTLTQDTVFTAIFQANIQRYTITVMSVNDSMGTVSGGGIYEEGSQVTITATAAEGYHFVSWNDGDTNNPRTITVTEDTTYIANFAVNTYTITVTSANDSMGTVSGGGIYEEGSQVTITATAAEGYHFVSWNDGDTNNPRTITVTEDTTYIANFAVNTYTITVTSANDSMGTVSGGGTYEEASQIIITATAAEGYYFVCWNDGNTDNPRTITVTEDATYIASFAEDVSTDAANELDALTFYPNPTNGTITFNTTDIRKVEVMDAMGRIVAVYNDSYIVDLSKLSKGHYTLRVTTDRGAAVRKVIRN